MEIAGVGPFRASAETEGGGLVAIFTLGKDGSPAAPAPAPAEAAPSPPPPRRKLTGPTAEMDELFDTIVEMKASDLHISVGSPAHASATTARSRRSRAAPCSPRRTRSGSCCPSPPSATARSSSAATTPTSPTRSPASPASAATSSATARAWAACSASIPSKIMTAEEMGLRQGDPPALPPAQGARARHRAHRLGQVHHALRAHRLHQPQPHATTSSPSRTRWSSCTRTRSA